MGSVKVRGQSSTEFLLLFAAAVAVFAILYSVTVGRSDAFNSRNLELSANLAVTDLANAAREVHAQGTGARKIVTINLPRSYDPDNSRISQNAIILRARNTDYVRTFSFVLQGSMPESTGTFYWAVENDGTSVVIGDKFARVNRTAISAVVIPGWDYADSILVSSSSLYVMNGTISLEWPSTDVSITCNSSNFSMAPFGSYEIPIQALMDYSAAGSYYGKLTISLRGQKGDQVFTIPITFTASKDKFNAVRFIPATPEDGAEVSGAVTVNASIASTKLTQQRFLWQGNYTYNYDDSLVLAYNFDDVKAIGDTASKVKDISLYGNDGAIYGNTALLLHMDEASGLKAYDESAYKNNGSCYNMGGYTGASRCNWVDGKSGKGIEFDGVNDYAQILDSTSLNFGTGDFAVEFWFNANSLNKVHTRLGEFVSKWSGEGDAWGWGVGYDWNGDHNNQLFFQIYGGGTSYKVISTDSSFSTGTWYHVVAVRTNVNDLLLFVNGILQDTSLILGTTTTGNVSSTTPVTLGTFNSFATSDYVFNGTLDEVGLYSRALSASEVLARYNAGRAKHADWDAEGKWGSAIRFSSMDYVEAADSTALDVTGDLSLEAWVKSNATAYAENAGIISKWRNMVGNPNQRAYELYVNKTDNAIGFAVSPDGTYPSSWSLRSHASISLDAWHHVVATFSPSQAMRIYINGVLDSEIVSGVPSAIFNSPAPLWLGTQYDLTLPSIYFNGSIDEVRVWNRSLSASEVRQHYYSNIAKYSPAIWVFTANERGVSSGSYDYRVYVRDSSGQENSTELRTVIVNNSLVSFVPPTPASGYLTTTASSLFYPPMVNASIRNVTNLSAMSFNWGGQSYSFYDPSLVLAYNLDYAEALGEGNVTKDISNYGNNGAVYGNTKMLLRFDENGSSGTAYDESAYKNNGAVYGNTRLLLHMDENAGTFANDSTAYGNNGTISGATWTSGKAESALSFNGVNSHVNLGSYAALNISNRVTVSAWVYLQNVNKLWQGIVAKGIGGNTGGYRLAIGNGQKPYFEVGLGGGGAAKYSSVTLQNNTWYHIVGAYDGSNLTIYVDGVSSSSPASGSLNLTGSSAYVGFLEGGAYLNGIIDEVAIYSKALNATEVLDQYNAGRAMHSDYVEGTSGTALQFDGVDDYVKTASFALSSANTTLSVEFWSKGTQKSATQSIIAEAVQPAAPGYIYVYRVSGSDSLAFQYANGTTYRTSSTGSYFTGLDNTWVHTVITADYTSRVIMFYRNGVLQATNSVSDPMLYPSMNRAKYVGAYSSTDPSFFNGSIDEVAVYSKALNATEVLDHYNAGKAKHADWTSAGKVNGAMEFDGVDDYVSIPDSSIWDFERNNFSVSFWFTKENRGWDHGNALSFGSGSNNLQFDFDDRDGGGWGVWVYWRGSGVPSVRLKNNYSDGNWHQLTFTRTNDIFSLYLDSLLLNSTSIVSNLTFSGGAYLGSDHGVTSYWKGMLDEVRIWNRSLSTDEIQQQYYGSLNKYASDKWLFTSTPQNYTGTYTYFASVTTNESVTESTPVQNLTMQFSRIGFIPPTPANGESTSNTTITVNASIYNLTLDSMAFNWNGTNSSFYDSSLVLAYNFDDVPAIGDTAGKIVDVSRQGNNGTIYGNTLLLLHMDEGTGSTVYDESVYKNNGTMNGATWVSGKSGSGLSFDGNDYVLTGALASPLYNDFSVEAWVYPKEIGVIPDDRMSIFTSTVGDFHFSLELGAWSTYSRAVIASKMGYGPAAVVNNTVSPNSWLHLVYVKRADNYNEIYLNGVKQSLLVDSTFVFNNTAETYYLGTRGGSQYFNGTIDEVVVANRSLSASEVLAHYNAGKAHHADWDPDGKWNSAMKFDGVNDYVVIPTTGMSVSAGAVSFWFKPTSVVSDGYLVTNTITTQRLYIRLQANSAVMVLGDPYTVIGPYNSVSPNTWYHFVGSWNSTFASMYINGQLVSSSSFTALSGISNPMYIGAYGVSNQCFNGSIDEVRIWNRSLSAPEVQQHYYGSLNKYAPDRWLFSSVQGNLTAGNYSYYGYAHGTSGDSNVTETRSVNILGDMVVFTPPTPANGSTVRDSRFQLNASIANLSLSKARVYTDGTGYDLYDDSLVLAYNFDDVASIGDSARQVTDISKYGNNGTVYGNTALLLHFDENSGSAAYDGSAYRNNGTISGAVWSAGKSGSGLQFDGVDDVVTVPNSASLNFTGPFSMEVWIKPSAVQSNLYPKVIAKQNHYVFHITQSLPSALVLNLFNASGLQQTGSNENALASGVWNHVVMTYNGSYVSMYVNGTQLTTNNKLITSLSPMTEEAVGIGKYPTSATPFNGSIDEVGLYNRSLSAAEVLAHYNAGKAKYADWNPNGAYGSAMKFDGINDYVNAGNSSSLNLPGPFTISFWWARQDSFALFFVKGTWDDRNYYAYYQAPAGPGISFSSGSASGASLGTSYFYVPPVGEYHHYTMGYDGNNVVIYVDGAKVASRGVGSQLLKLRPTFPLYIGTHNPGYVTPLEGTLDEFRIWNRSLSNSEVMQNYYSSLSKYAPGKWLFQSNLSNIDNGAHSLSVWVQDAYGSTGAANRSIQVSNSVSFVPPTHSDGTLTSYAAVAAAPPIINATVQGIQLAAFNLSVNGADYPFYDDSLVLAYNFDNIAELGDSATSVVDVSRRGNTGIVSGATWNTSGISGGSMTFDGVDDYVSAGTPSSLNVTRDLTITAWINPATSMNWNQLVRKYRSYAFGVINNDELSLRYYTGGVWSTCATTSTANMLANRWYHVAVTRSFSGTAGTCAIYVNGAQNVTGSLAGYADSPAEEIVVGSTGGSSEFFSGSMDEVRVYNRSLTAAEVAQQYYGSLNKYAADKWVFTSAQSGLSAGAYSYSASALDSNGFVNSTGPRRIAVSNSRIGFMPPTPESAAYYDLSAVIASPVVLNVSIVDSSFPQSIVFNWNGTNQSVYDNSLILSYNFDNVSAIGENATRAVDFSLYGNNGTIVNGTAWTSQGRYGNALDFDGINDWVDAGNSSSLDVNNSFSIEMWMKRRARSASFVELLRRGSGDAYSLYNYANSEDMVVRFEDTTSVHHLGAIVSVPTGVWNHVVGLYDGQYLLFYLNGVLASNASVGSYAVMPGSNSLVIGRDDPQAGRFFNGTIDEVRVYNRSLSSAEVLQHYYSNLRKYSPTRWVFESVKPISQPGSYPYYAYLNDSTGSNQTEVRTLNVGSNSWVSFLPPTLANNALTYAKPIVVNASVAGISLGSFGLNWNGVNYPFYDSSLVLALNFDNASSIGDSASNAVDVSQYGNNGSISGAAWNASGKYGGALSFDGVNDFVNVTSIGTLSGDVTIYAWINASPLQTGNYIYFLDLSRASGSGIQLALYSDGRVTNDNAGGPTYMLWGPRLNDYRWHHVAMARQGTTYSLYVDGQFQNSTPGTSVTYTNLQVGKRFTGSSYFNGSIDEVRVWSRALSADEIQQQYYSNLAKYAPDRWLFTSNQGSFEGSHNFSAYAIDSQGRLNSTETRTINVAYDWVSFVAPTPANGSVSYNSNINIAANVTDVNLSEFLFNWNGTNTTFYNDSLVLGYNFDDVASVGDSASKVVDISRDGNNGLIYAATKALLHLDENSGTTTRDESNNSYACVISGPTWTMQSKSGSALDFDGNGDYLVCSGLSVPENGTASIEAWVNMRELASEDSTAKHLFTNLLYQHPANNYFYVQATNDYFSWAPSKNTWYHIVLTYNNQTTSAKLYHNGVATSISLQGAYHVMPVWSGNIGHSSGNYAINGTLDEVAVYNRELTAAEVVQHYAAGRAHHDGWDPNGKWNSAIKFDGVDDYVLTPSFALSSPSSSLTYSFWLKSYPVSSYGNIITDNSESGSSGFIWVHRTSASGLRAEFANGTNWIQPIASNFFTGYDGAWLKADVVFDFANRWVKFYRNGALFYWYNSSTPILFPSANRVKYVGGSTNTGYGEFNGSIDEFRLWNRVLSDSEVAQSYYASMNKYAPDKWLFRYQNPSVPEGTYSYYAYAKDASGSFDLSETRTTQVGNIVGFVPPTPDDGSAVSIGAIAGGAVINASAYSSNLSSFLFNWDGTSYTYYDSSLVLAYNFDNNSAIGETATKAVDVSPYGNNGTLSGATWSANGKYGRALQFDGFNDYLDAGSGASLNVTSAFAVETWVNSFILPSSEGQRGTIVSKEVGGSNGWGIRLEEPGLLSFYFRTPSYSTLNSAARPQANVWYHVVGVWDGVARKLYVNGVLNNSDLPSSFLSSSNSLSVGRLSSGSYYFNGLIDEVRVYNRALSADEVALHYYSSFNKYAPDKWLFQFSPEAYLGDHAYYAYAADASGNASYSETRGLNVEKHAIGFMPPTPADGTASDNTSLSINASVAGIQLSSAKLTVDGANYSFYDDSLVAAYNFDNVASLNDSAGKATDFSRYSNNATLYGNTLALLHFDEGTGSTVYDESAYRNNGTLTGGAAWSVGTSGKGIAFDGSDDYISIPQSASFNAVNAFSVSFWVKHNTSVATYAGYVAKGTNSSDKSIMIFKDVYSNGLFVNLYGTSGGQIGRREVPVANQNLWNHVIVTYDGGSSYIATHFYINGYEVSGSPDDSGTFGSLRKNTGSLTVASNFGRLLNGSMDEFAFYNRSLSSFEALALYQSGRAAHMDYTSAGKYSGGLLFDGADDYAQTAQPVALGTGDLTFSAWVKGTPMAADSEQGIISAYYSGKPWFFSLERSTYSGCDYSGCLSVHVGYPDQSPYILQAGNWPAADEGWHFVAVTRSSAAMSLFLDGTEVVSSSQPGFTGFDVGTRYLRIGAPSQGYFNGTIDEVRVYNRSMSATELRQQYYSSLNKYAPDRWLFSGVQQNLAVGNHSYQLHVFDFVSSRANSTSLRTYNVMPNAYIGFTAPTISSGTYDFTYLAASPAAVNLTVNNTALSNLTLYWNSTNYTFYDSSLVLGYNFDSLPAFGESSSLAKDFSVYSNHGTLTSNSTNGVVDDFERRNWLGWIEGCGGNTELSLTKGYRSKYALSIKARGGDGYACALKNATVTNGSSLSYACKGDLCQICLYNGTACCNTQMVCDYGLGDGDSGWRVCNVVATYSGNMQARFYSSFYNGTHYNNTPGALSTYDFLTFGPIPAEGKYGSALQFDGVDDYVSFTPPISSIPTDLTVEAWMYRKSNVSHRIAVALSDSAGIYGTEAAHILLSNHNGKLAFRAGGNGYELLAGNGLQYLSSSDGWYHVVGMKSGTSYYLYVNGQLAAQTTQSGISGTIARASIGDTLHPAYTYNDKVDEVRIWNRSFTADEIAQHYYSNLQKYAPDKWLFQSSQPIHSPGTSAFYAWAGGNGEASTEVRTVVADATSKIGFIPTTPASSSTVYSGVIGINVSIANASGLSVLAFEKDGANYSFYDSSLVLAYNFDNVASLGENASRVVDVSAYGNNGAVTGANYTQSGRYGSALNFSANNQYLRFESTPVLNITDAITLEAWVRPAEMQTCAYSFIVSKYWRWYLNLSQYTNLPMFKVTSVSSVMGSSGLNPGDWYHLVGTYANDGSENNFRLYVNGQLEAQKTAGGAIPLIVREGYVGRADASSLGCGFNGTIDEVRVYNRSMSSDEVSQHYYSNLQKHAPDKWLFQSVQRRLASGSHSFNVYAKDSTGAALPLSARTFNARTIQLSAPTPQNGIVQYDNNLTINATIGGITPREVIFNWNGESYSFYDDSLVAAYNFDNVASIGDSASNAVDVSRQENNGTLMNGIVWTPDGRWGGAMQFNGVGDFISLGHLPAMYEPSWTFFAWFKPMNDTAWVYQTIYSSGYGVSGALDRNEQLLVDVNATWLNVRQYALNDGSGTWHEAHVNITSRAFNNVAVVRTSLTNYDIYLNGEFQKSLQVFNANRQTIIDTIGARYTGIYGSFFNGTIDEVRIWNRSLSSEEVAQHYYSNLAKYAPDKWVFTSAQPGAGAQTDSYYLTVLDENGNATVGESRTNTFNKILFHQPSVANNQLVYSPQFNLNATVQKAGQLSEFKASVAGTNSVLLNDSLVLAMNFDDVASIGETAFTVRDFSRYGNNGAIYGNTRFLMHMDENAGSVAYDESRFKNNGTCYNMGGGSGVTACNWTVGKSGTGLQFDGVDDYVQSSQSFSAPEYITTSFWVKSVRTSDWQWILNGGQSVALGSYSLVRVINSDTLQYRYSNGVDATLAAGVNSFFTGYDGTWMHIAIVADYVLNQTTFYRNGVRLETDSLGAPIRPTTTYLKLGIYDTRYPFNGSIDEVLVANRSLSDSEVLAQYDAGKAHHADWNPDGRWNSSIRFDGIDHYVVVPDSPSLNITNRLTMAAWVNLKPADVGYSGRIILGKGPANYYQNYGLWTNQGATSFFVQLNTTHDYGMPGYSTDLTNGWHHLAATYDGTVTKFFLDGALVKVDYGYSGPILPTTSPLIISSASQRAVNGSVDEVRVYDRSLSASEISQLYYSNLAKYAPDKWVFSSYWNSSEDVNDDHPYYLFASTTAGNASYSQVRTLRLRKNMVSFLAATPSDGATSPTNNVTINATIQNISLSKLALNWNGTNTTVYDRNSLILAYNFDDVQSIGDSASRAADVSGNGNNGTIIGNTLLMLRMDEAGGNFSYDEGRLSNNGTCYNMGGLSGVSACNWTAGKSNSGISFDGDNDAIRLSGNVTLPGPFTFSTWFNKRSTGTYQSFTGVDAGFSCSGGCPKIIFYSGADYIFVRTTPGGDSTNINVGYNPVTMDNQWNFLTVTRDASGVIRASLNGGAFVAGASLSGTMDVIRVGMGDSGQYFNGTLDEFAVYNRSINQTEATALYNQGRARHADWDANGKWGSALKFDGVNDYVELPGSSSYINSNGTITAWVKFASLPPATAGYMTIASTVNASQTIGWKFELYESSGAYRLAFRKWTPEQSANTIIPTPTLGQWVHLAASWNGTNIMLYRNGVLESRNSIGSPTPGSSVLRIGTDTRALFQQSLNGSIDEFGLWNVSLSSDEIRQQYYSSLNKFAPDKWLFTSIQQSQPSGTHNYTIYIDNGNTVYNSTQARAVVVS